MLFIIQNLQKDLLIQFGITESWNGPTKSKLGDQLWIQLRLPEYFSNLQCTVFARLSAQSRTPPPPPPPLFFMVRGGMASAIVMKNFPPIRSKKSKITYLSSCRVCKPALNSTISAVHSRSHCSYSLHDCTIYQLTTLSHLSKLNSTSAKVQ